MVLGIEKPLPLTQRHPELGFIEELTIFSKVIHSFDCGFHGLTLSVVGEFLFGVAIYACHEVQFGEAFDFYHFCPSLLEEGFSVEDIGRQAGFDEEMDGHDCGAEVGIAFFLFDFAFVEVPIDDFIDCDIVEILVGLLSKHLGSSHHFAKELDRI